LFAESFALGRRVVALMACCATTLLLTPALKAQTFTVLKSFGILTNVTGWHPEAPLTLGPDGTLYGTTSYGEGNVRGVVFKIQPDGSGFAVLKLFTNWVEGANPEAGLVLSGNTLYGTASNGGTLNNGASVSLSTDGSGFAVL